MEHSNLLKAKRVYMVGVKGAGMAALAHILQVRGVAVSGSDTNERFFTDKILKRLKIPYTEGFDPANIPSDAELCIYSTAYSPDHHPEILAAIHRGLPVLSYPAAVGELTLHTLTLAVSGTHGKTTTTALLAEVLHAAGQDPLALVGGQVRGWTGNAMPGKGRYFVLEADEYQNKFQHYTPWGVILTSLDWDHPDFFPDASRYRETFVDFLLKVPPAGFVIGCADDANVVDVLRAARSRTITYGFHADAMCRIADWEGSPRWHEGLLQTFRLIWQEGETDWGTFSLRLPGRHNAQNAAAAVAAAFLLNCDLETIRKTLAAFRGVARRFEYVGEYRGALVFDDYAHHPVEIQATLKAARGLFPERRLIAIFHPHTFTRTKALLQEFSQSFEEANQVLVLDIYGSAREEPEGPPANATILQAGALSEELVELINTYTPGKAEYVPSLDDAAAWLEANITAEDVVFTLGAGNVWEVGKRLVG